MSIFDSFKKKSEEDPTKPPKIKPNHEDAVAMCNSIRTGRGDEFLEWLERRPKDEIISRFLGIIYSKWAFLPIVGVEETPPVQIDGVLVDSIQNIAARITTKISLLLIIEAESKKLDIWNQIQSSWTEKYILEIKEQVQVFETIVKGWEDSGYESRAADLRKGIEAIKEDHKKYAIDW